MDSATSLLHDNAIMITLFCVTVVAILAAEALVEVMFHSSIFFLYCHLRKEKGSLSRVNTVDGEVMGCLGLEYKQTSVFIVSSPVFPGGAGLGDGREEGEALTALASRASNPGDNWRGKICIKGCP